MLSVIQVISTLATAIAAFVALYLSTKSIKIQEDHLRQGENPQNLGKSSGSYKYIEHGKYMRGYQITR